MQPELSLTLCKSILNKSGIGGVDYAINPYIGCQHGCLYCYAKFMKRYSGHKEPWGGFVDIKINALEVLERQLKKARHKRVFIASVTDAYQPAERKHRLTRKILEQLIRIKTSIYLQTKSDLVQRDIDVIKSLADVEVCWTIITLDEKDRQLLEPGAPAIKSRLNALESFANVGIKTAAFVGPLMPFMSEKRVIELLNTLHNCGAKKIFLDRLNYARRNEFLLRRALIHRYPEFTRNLTAPYDSYYQRVARIFESFCADRGIEFVSCI